MNVNRIPGSRQTRNVSRQRAVKGDFAGELTAALRASEGKSQDEKRPADSMSDLEYEAYINKLIDKMPRSGHSKQDDWVIVSKEGLAAMKADPDYEKWALNEIYKQVNQPVYFAGSKSKVHNYIYIGGTKEECKFESCVTNERMYEDGFSGPTRDEIRRAKKEQAKKNEKLRKYARTLRENSIEKADMELEHIRGIYQDQLHSRKNICAVLGDIDKFWLIGTK